jgi:N-glycosylase/DNA lyase
MKKKDLAGEIKKLQKTGISRLIAERMEEFSRFCEKDSRSLYKEMCFCLLTANYSAERGIVIHEEIGNGFLNLPEKELSERLQALGYRYPNKRAQYIQQARRHMDCLRDVVDAHADEQELREWVVTNVKGLGHKEASHFLRNIGLRDLAIIDFHIIDILSRYGLIKEPKTLTKNKYLEIEKALSDLGKKTGLCLGELDLYLWFMETGKVLK